MKLSEFEQLYKQITDRTSAELIEEMNNYDGSALGLPALFIKYVNQTVFDVVVNLVEFDDEQSLVHFHEQHRKLFLLQF